MLTFRANSKSNIMKGICVWIEILGRKILLGFYFLLKKIEELGIDTSEQFIMKLKPSSFKYNESESGRTQKNTAIHWICGVSYIQII